MKTKDINNRYSQLLKDINFDRLDLELKNPNIFHQNTNGFDNDYLSKK